MSYRQGDAVSMYSQSKGAPREILRVLAAHAHEDGGNAFLSITTIQHEANIGSRTTVIRGLQILEHELGEIIREGTRPSGTPVWRITLLDGRKPLHPRPGCKCTLCRRASDGQCDCPKCVVQSVDQGGPVSGPVDPPEAPGGSANGPGGPVLDGGGPVLDGGGPVLGPRGPASGPEPSEPPSESEGKSQEPSTRAGARGGAPSHIPNQVEEKLITSDEEDDLLTVLRSELEKCPPGTKGYAMLEQQLAGEEERLARATVAP